LLIYEAKVHYIPAMDQAQLNTLICHETPDFLVVNKPAGLLVHPVAADSVALTHWLIARDPLLRPAHRLDRETSGALLCGRGPQALRRLGLMFMRGQIDKTYRALVHGQMADEAGVIDAPLIKRNALMVVDAAGASALTQWRVLERREDSTLMELKPQTGRTHQLRAHMAYLGHPIVGDAKYGGPASPRMWLHSFELGLPDGTNISAAAPAELNQQPSH